MTALWPGYDTTSHPKIVLKRRAEVVKACSILFVREVVRSIAAVRRAWERGYAPASIRRIRSPRNLVKQRRPIGRPTKYTPTSFHAAALPGLSPWNTAASPSEVTNTARSSEPVPLSIVQVPIAMTNPPREKIWFIGNSTAAPPREEIGRYQNESFDFSMKKRRCLKALTWMML